MNAHVPRARGRLRRQAVTGVAAQCALSALLWRTVGLGPAGWLAAAAASVPAWALLVRALRRAGAATLGPADRVTGARAVLVGGVLALVADGAAGTGFAALVLCVPALILDAVDGKVARRTGTASAVGARFDMETDAFLILVLSVQVAFAYGAWVLAIGVMRYAFGAAALAAPWMRAPVPPSQARKAVAVVQGVVLTAAASGLLPRQPGSVLTGMSLALLVWSFGRDGVWQWRARTTAPVTEQLHSRDGTHANV